MFSVLFIHFAPRVIDKYLQQLSSYFVLFYVDILSDAHYTGDVMALRALNRTRPANMFGGANAG